LLRLAVNEGAQVHPLDRADAPLNCVELAIQLVNDGCVGC
jgi:hypothetical protein